MTPARRQGGIKSTKMANFGAPPPQFWKISFVPILKTNYVGTTWIWKPENDADTFEDFSLVEKMVAMANKAGAITTTNYGAIVALPTKEDLEK